MSTGKKIWLGILSIAPGFMFMGYIFFMFASVFDDISNPGYNNEMPRYMGLAIFLIIGGFILTTIITIYHIIHISKDVLMSSNDKLVWILIVLLLPWLGDIIFWYMRIWKEPKPDPNTSTFY